MKMLMQAKVEQFIKKLPMKVASLGMKPIPFTRERVPDRTVKKGKGNVSE